MSTRKYVPSFLKNQDNRDNRDNRVNSFSALSDTTIENTVDNTCNTVKAVRTFVNTQKPLINTSKSAIEAPKLVPATLASLTSSNPSNVIVHPATISDSCDSEWTFAKSRNISDSSTTVKKTFAYKYSKQLNNSYNNTADANKDDRVYKNIESGVRHNTGHIIANVSSDIDFPTLGGKHVDKKVPIVPKSTSFSNLARDWAKQKEEEEEEELRLQIKEQKKRRELELLGKIAPTIVLRKKIVEDLTDDEEDCKPDYEDSLGEDEYDLPDEDGEHTTDDDDDDEFNSELAWDGRRKDDLY